MIKSLTPYEPCWWCSRRLLASYAIIEKEGHLHKVHHCCQKAIEGAEELMLASDDAEFDENWE